MTDLRIDLGRDELVVDNFAGGGGASTGIEAAIGRHADVAVNHDAEAIAMHAANHPDTKHYHSDVWEVDPVEATNGKPVGLAWFSPDCRHFSKAKGAAPVAPKVRGLAWVVVRWAKKVAPRVIVLENVEEFETWGPLLNGQPDPDRKGETFRKWRRKLERLGYVLEWRALVAADYGAPTTRKRLYLIARRDGRPIVWPAPTHGIESFDGKGSGDGAPWRKAIEIIDWAVPCQDVATRKRPLAPKTQQRIAKGIERFVLNGKPTIVRELEDGRKVAAFLTKYYGTGAVGQRLEEPLHTVTTKARFALVEVTLDGDQVVAVGMRMLRPRELYAAQGFPADYQIELEIDGRRLAEKSQIRMCGNSVSPRVARELVAANLREAA